MQYFKTVKGVLNVEYDHIIRLTDPVKPKLTYFADWTQNMLFFKNTL